MERRPEAVRGKLQIFQEMEKESQLREKPPELEYHAALIRGELGHVQPFMDQLFPDANVVFEIRKEEMEWQAESPATFGLSGLWTLEYKRELTTPLRIAAAHGHTACVRHLLDRGADPDATPGGRGALHEACLGAHTACARLLLRHRAYPDLASADGLAPLHLCHAPASLGCAQALLEHGASVQRAGGTGQDTPLHVAAQHGLDDHARLYLDRGARVDARNSHGETALSLACGAAQRPDDPEHAHGLRLCALLLQHGAVVDARDEDERTPLHKACGHAQHSLVRLLLRHGAHAGALDYGGASPLARALTAACAPAGAAQSTIQVLLNHGSPTVWPDAFPKERACDDDTGPPDSAEPCALPTAPQNEAPCPGDEWMVEASSVSWLQGAVRTLMTVRDRNGRCRYQVLSDTLNGMEFIHSWAGRNHRRWFDLL